MYIKKNVKYIIIIYSLLGKIWLWVKLKPVNIFYF